MIKGAAMEVAGIQVEAGNSSWISKSMKIVTNPQIIVKKLLKILGL